MAYIKYIKPTADEAEKIKKGDKPTADKYFLANYDLILTTCKAYCASNILEEGLALDMLNECYIYFPTFKFSSSCSFVRNVKDICVFVRFGGERLYHQYRQGNTEILTILDAPITEGRHGGVFFLADVIPSPFDIYKEIEHDCGIADIVFNYVCKFLALRQVEAFKYFYYTDLTAREVGRYLGISINGAQSLKTSAIYKLRKHKDEIRAFMNTLGYKISA